MEEQSVKCIKRYYDKRINYFDNIYNSGATFLFYRCLEREDSWKIEGMALSFFLGRVDF